MEKVEIDSADVIKLILQFLKENNLSESWKVLSNESKIHMNTVDDIDLLISDIQNGKWDSVLTQIDTMQLPISKSQLIYEQVIIELLEASERELAKAILREVYPLKSLKESHPERYLKLELLCKRPFFNSSDAYDSGQSKESRRQNIIDLLIPEIAIVQPSRLLTLLNHSLRYQLHQGMISKGNRYDLFRGQRKSAKKDQEEKLPKRVAGQITFNSNSHPETITFSNDGQSLVTGSVDGLIEIWDPDSCKIRDDLEYQAKDNYMAHIDDTVLCVTFSKDTDILASGSMAGDIKVWKLSSGACVRRFDQAHPKGITSLCFGRDGSQLLSTSFDCTARLHGLKSGRTLREFR
jgi:WD40 repeat-containing protein SMU1